MRQELRTAADFALREVVEEHRSPQAQSVYLRVPTDFARREVPALGVPVTYLQCHSCNFRCSDTVLNASTCSQLQ